MCEASGIAVDAIRTERAGHARELAAGLKPGQYAVVVAVSGDGMLHEVLNGLVEGSGVSSQALSILPGGSSNGVATSMTSRDPFNAVVSLIQGEVREPDTNTNTTTYTGSREPDRGRRQPFGSFLACILALYFYANFTRPPTFHSTRCTPFFPPLAAKEIAEHS